MRVFHDVNGHWSFTRVWSGVIIAWSLFMISVMYFKGGKMPDLSEAATPLSLIASALAGKVIQRPFEKENSSEKKR